MLKRARYKTKGFFKELSANSNYLPDDVVNLVYYGLLKMIGARLKKRGKINCPDLGVFETYVRKPHMFLEVRTRIPKVLPEKTIVKFRTCRKMKTYFHAIDKEDSSSMI